MDRTLLFILGAIVITYFGTQLHFFDSTTARKALTGKIDVLGFLLGMNIITVVLSRGGLFDHLARKIAATAGEGLRGGGCRCA